MRTILIYVIIFILVLKTAISRENSRKVSKNRSTTFISEGMILNLYHLYGTFHEHISKFSPVKLMHQVYSDE